MVDQNKIKPESPSVDFGPCSDQSSRFKTGIYYDALKKSSFPVNISYIIRLQVNITQ